MKSESGVGHDTVEVLSFHQQLTIIRLVLHPENPSVITTVISLHKLLLNYEHIPHFHRRTRTISVIELRVNLGVGDHWQLVK